MSPARSSRKRYNEFVEDYKQRRLDAKSDDDGGPPPATPGRPGARRAYLREYLRWLKPHRNALGAVFLLALIVAGLQMIEPLFIRFIVDHVILNKGLDNAARLTRLNLTGLVFLSVVVLSHVGGGFKDYRQRLLNVRVMLSLRRSLYERLLHLPLPRLWEMKTGGILSRLTGDVETTTGLLQMAIVSPAISVIRLVIAIVILIALNWQLALTAMAIIPGVMVLSLIFTRRIRPIYRSVRKDVEVVDGRVGETFAGIRVVRAFRQEIQELLSYMLGRHTVLRKELFAHRRELLLWTSWGLLEAGISVVIVWFGGYLNIVGRASVGDIMAFQWYMFLLLNPVWNIVNSFSEMQRSLAAMERVFEVLAMEDDKPDRPHAHPAPALVRELRFDDVAFEYRAGQPVVRDFNVAVPGGSVVALVGRDLLAIVQQEVFLFDGSVCDNLAYGRHDATDAEVEDAAQRANAHGFIVRLPQGYETWIGERGVKLSGGQQQRLAIARAILASPQILILDEATSNLDTESEQLIQASMADLLAGRTTFVIAHRLSTIRRADLILLMENGAIIERGTHEDLMRARGIYYEMVKRQMESHARDGDEVLR